MVKKQPERPGKTIVTTISVTRELFDLVKQHNLSASDVFRTGVGVRLCEAGVPGYNSKTNKERIETYKEFIKLSNLDEEINTFEHFLNELKKIRGKN